MIKWRMYRLNGSSPVVFSLRWPRMTLGNLLAHQLEIVNRQKPFKKMTWSADPGRIRTRAIDSLKFDSMFDNHNLYFKRRTGLMAEDVDADALKKSLKRSKKVKSQDTMSIESWKSTSSRGENMHVKSACINDKKFRNSNRRKNPIRHSERRNRSPQITQNNSFYYLSVNFCFLLTRTYSE